MSSERCRSALLFFVYLLALIQPGQAAASFRPVAACAPEYCTASSIDVRSHPLVSAGQPLRLFNESTRQPNDVSFRFTAGIPDTSRETTAALFASGRAATLEHRAVLQSIRAASLGSPACAPRSPPAIR